MFDRHEVILADGVWTESFQPEDDTLAGLDNARRSEIFEIFPETAALYRASRLWCGASGSVDARGAKSGAIGRRVQR